MPKHDEISRFSSSGKTFFFNKAEAKNGSPYLAINALYGRGNQERVVLFEPHMAEFLRHARAAVAEVLGMEPKIEDTARVDKCPKCDSGPARHRVLVSKSQKEWTVYCYDCHEILYENVADAYKTIEKENE